MKNKLKIIILSSSKLGLPIANSLKTSLLQVNSNLNVNVWNEDPIFEPATFTLTRLLELNTIFDFAIVILTPDEMVLEKKSKPGLRGKTTYNYLPKDNVIFEMGLFLSSLGIERTFILRQGNVKLPSDIGGIYFTQFDIEGDNFDNSIKIQCTDKIVSYINKKDIQPFTFSNDNKSKTNSLGDIPYLLPEANKLLKKAKKGDTIKICCDFPAYGCFSCPETWLEYTDELENLGVKGVDLSFICANQKIREEISNWQFPIGSCSGDKWDGFKLRKIDESQPTYHENIKTFISIIKKEKKMFEFISAKMKIPLNPTREELIQLMEYADQFTYKNVPHSLKKAYSKPIPIYYWIFDTEIEGKVTREAVFTLACFNNKRFEYGFHTKDKELIDALEQLPIKFSPIQ